MLQVFQTQEESFGFLPAIKGGAKMKKFLISALLVMCFVIPVFATGITWFGEGRGRVGIGTSKDNVGFIVFVDKVGSYTYIWVDSDYATLPNYSVRHSLMITHSAAFYVTHTPETEEGYFNINKKGVNLIGTP